MAKRGDFQHWLDELNNQQWQIEFRNWNRPQFLPWDHTPSDTNSSGAADVSPTSPSSDSSSNPSSDIAAAVPSGNAAIGTGGFHWNHHHGHHFHTPSPPDSPPPPPPPPPPQPPLPQNSPGVLSVTSSSPDGAIEGATLSAKVTDADGLGTMAYKWQEKATDGTWHDIQGASGKDYLLGFNDGGHDIRSLATYTDQKGNLEAPQSTVTAIDVDRLGALTVKSDSALGFITGAKITADVTDPDGVGSVSYQWSSKSPGGQWHDIAGANSASYTLSATDVGNEIDVVGTYIDNQSHHDTAADPFTVVAAPVVPEPPVTPPPPPPPPPAPPPNSPGVLSLTSSSPNGDIEGATLTAKVTDTDGAAGIAYQWQADNNGVWQNIAGATGQTHLVGFNDGGHNFRVLANYTDQQGHQESLQSTFTAIDVDRPGTVTVTSSSTDGFVTGAAIAAHVSDPDGLGSVSYQWASMSTGGQWQNIAGATSSTYTLTNNDAGKQIDVTAHYTDGQGHSDVAADPFTVAAAPAPTPVPSGGNEWLMGVNIATAAFGTPTGTFGTNYAYPTHAEIDYFASKGMDVIRLAFLWEHLQPTANGPLNAAELARIDDITNYANSLGLKVILDPHNYAQYYGQDVGTAQVPNSAFANFWGQLAGHFADNPDVIFGLMNEPHDQGASQWLTSANAAIAAIRDAGAHTQEILVPGTGWDSGLLWNSSGNASVMANGVQDPNHNYAFEIHQYFDSDGSGTHSPVVSATIGIERLTEVTQWAESVGAKLFLGEFGVATDSTSLTTLNNTLTYMQQHSDVWQGGTYWAGGAWWGSYMYSIEPTGLGTSNVVDKAQMTILEQHLNPAIPLSG